MSDSLDNTHEKERDECRRTFSKVRWLTDVLTDEPIRCPHCESELVAQSDPENSDQHDMECECRACGEAVSSEQAIEETLRALCARETYLATKYGGDLPLHPCPGCGVEAYLLTEKHNGCAWCGTKVEGRCAHCGEQLTPENVPSGSNGGCCSRCAHVMSKDD